MDIESIYESGSVERFHVVPGVSNQKVSEHSWGVAMLCQYLDPFCKKYLILAALTHDCAELITGDVPATAKWQDKKLKESLKFMEDGVLTKWDIDFEKNLDHSEKRLLKLCDCLEGMKYCVSRYKCGELQSMDVFLRWSDYILNNFELSRPESNLFRSIMQDMSNVSSSKSERMNEREQYTD